MCSDTTLPAPSIVRTRLRIDDIEAIDEKRDMLECFNDYSFLYSEISKLPGNEVEALLCYYETNGIAYSHNGMLTEEDWDSATTTHKSEALKLFRCTRKRRRKYTAIAEGVLAEMVYISQSIFEPNPL